jgi:hypothetical protein
LYNSSRKTIKYIDAKKENILIPSVVMLKFHVEISNSSLDVGSEMNA